MSDTSMSLLSCRSHLKLTSLKFCYFPMRTSNFQLASIKTATIACFILYFDSDAAKVSLTIKQITF
jgi:hypothetical protein